MENIFQELLIKCHYDTLLTKPLITHKSTFGLKNNIKKAKDFSHLTEEERQDPLFISGALHKDDRGKYHLKIVPFQEFMNKKHMLKFLEKERTFFRYNGQCYEECSDDRLNNICQAELDKHRELFTPSSKAIPSLLPRGVIRSCRHRSI